MDRLRLQRNKERRGKKINTSLTTRRVRRRSVADDGGIYGIKLLRTYPKQAPS